MSRFRWWLFKRISAVGWWICPEPHRTVMQAHMPDWGQIADGLAPADPEDRENG